LFFAGGKVFFAVPIWWRRRMGNALETAASEALVDPELENEKIMCRCSADERDSSTPGLRFLSLNVPTKGDEFVRDAWKFRRRGVADLVRMHGVTLFCLQETHRQHTVDVHNELLRAAGSAEIPRRRFSFVGRGRNADGSDEYQVTWSLVTFAHLLC
jgi:hypothetical protein